MNNRLFLDIFKIPNYIHQVDYLPTDFAYYIIRSLISFTTILQMKNYTKVI